MSTIKRFEAAPTQFQKVGDIRIAYREIGAASGVPVIFLNHLGAVLDNWDPRVVDGIAAKHRVIVFDNRGICQHAGICTDTLASVFRAGAEPFVDLSAADKDAIIQTVRQCPSGALSHALDGIEHRDQQREPRVTVSKDGAVPLWWFREQAVLRRNACPHRFCECEIA